MPPWFRLQRRYLPAPPLRIFFSFFVTEAARSARLPSRLLPFSPGLGPFVSVLSSPSFLPLLPSECRRCLRHHASNDRPKKRERGGGRIIGGIGKSRTRERRRQPMASFLPAGSPAMEVKGWVCLAVFSRFYRGFLFFLAPLCSGTFLSYGPTPRPWSCRRRMVWALTAGPTGTDV